MRYGSDSIYIDPADSKYSMGRYSIGCYGYGASTYTIVAQRIGINGSQ
jgi:hypothetical protein